MGFDISIFIRKWICKLITSYTLKRFIYIFRAWPLDLISILLGGRHEFTSVFHCLSTPQLYSTTIRHFVQDTRIIEHFVLLHEKTQEEVMSCEQETIFFHAPFLFNSGHNKYIVGNSTNLCNFSYSRLFICVLYISCCLKAKTAWRSLKSITVI